MRPSPVEALRTGIHDRWRGDGLVAAELSLVHLGVADVERPAELVHVLRLTREGRPHAVIGIVDLTDRSPAGPGFDSIRDFIRDVSHFMAMHLNPPSLVDDAQVWAVAPAGSNDVEGWKRLRAEVHQDTWSLPKSVWLPSAHPDPQAFLREGVLAAPWQHKVEEGRGVEGEDAAGGDPSAQHDGRATGSDVDFIGQLAEKLSSKRNPWDRERVQLLVDTFKKSQADADADAIASELLQMAVQS